MAVPHKSGRLLAYASCIRYRDVLILQGAPLLGMAFALGPLTLDKAAFAAAFALASVLLVAHIFSFNDWAGIALDSNDPNKWTDVFVTRGISRPAMALLSLGMLGGSLLLFALLRWQTFLVAIAIATLGALYSHPSFNAKGTPVASSLSHLIGGMLHFLLGYSAFRGIDHRGMLIALFFALTFTAGHLNQEVCDHDGDRLNGIRTNAVAFGKQSVFVMGLLLFTLAYAHLFALAYAEIVPAPLALLPIVLYPVHVLWSVTTMGAGLSFGSVSRFRNRYRMLYAVIGATMVATLFLR